LLACKTSSKQLFVPDSGWRETPAGTALVGIARHLDELALQIRMVGIETLASDQARFQIVDVDVRARCESIKFEDGRGSR
jgi:hypothetical protein